MFIPVISKSVLIYTVQKSRNFELMENGMDFVNKQTKSEKPNLSSVFPHEENLINFIFVQMRRPTKLPHCSFAFVGKKKKHFNLCITMLLRSQSYQTFFFLKQRFFPFLLLSLAILKYRQPSLFAVFLSAVLLIRGLKKCLFRRTNPSI
jgi:hypothetical protein